MNVPALFLTSAMIWGSTWLAIKFQLGVVAPEISLVYRFALAGALLALWCAATGRSLRFSLRQHGYLAALGVGMFGLNYLCVYWAEQYVTSGLVAVAFSTITFMNPVGMRLCFGTPVAGRMFIAALLGVVGVTLLFLPELSLARHGGNVAWGIALALASAAIASAGNMVAMRNNADNMAVFPSTAWGMAYGALTAAMVGTLRGVPWSFDASAPYVLSLLYLAVVGSVLAFGAYLTLLKRVGGGPAAFVSVLSPVVAMILSTLFEGYLWTWVAGVGVVLAVIGNYIALMPARRRDIASSN
jgi:drug/metabolite transporter (DMT)-like permease